MNSANEQNSGSYKESIIRLSHFSPASTDDYGNQMLDYLVLDALHTFENIFISLKDIKASIKQNVFLEFEEEEILTSCKRLQGKKFVTVTEVQNRFEKPKIKISDKATTKLVDNTRSIKELESTVIETWKQELLDKYNSHEDLKRNLERLADILLRFTTKMFIKHGVETVSILYPSDNKIKQWLKNNGKDVLDGFLGNQNTFFDSIVRIEIPLFFQTENENRIRYISNLFNASFFWHLIQVDEKCSKLLQNVTRGQKLFLDNNIIYSLVGLHGNDALESGHSMLKFAKSLGYELHVTTKTIDEYHNTLRFHLSDYKKNNLKSAKLAEIALKELGADDFITVYWQNLVRTGISIEEFIVEKSHIDDILKGLNIQIFAKYREDIESSQELLDEMSKLRKACGDHYNNNIIEHDAFHRILIRKLRKGPKYNFNVAKAWFLTHDHKLPHYSRFALQGTSEIPFCITTNEWIQLNRPFISRTSDDSELETSFYTLMTQSYVRSFLPLEPLEKSFNKVLDKVNRFSGMTEDFAVQLASDTHFMMQLTSISDDVEIDKMIENRLIDQNKELRRQKEALILEKKQAEDKVQKLAQKNEDLSVKLSEKENSIQLISENFESIETRKTAKINELTQINNGQKEKINSLANELDELRQKVELKKYRALGYWSIVPFSFMVLMVILVFTFQTQNWNFVASIFNWANNLKELQKEVFKWGLGIVYLGMQLLLVKVIWKRLFKRPEKQG